MINDTYSFIFVHLNRTGGTSIEKLFNPEADIEKDGFSMKHDPHKHLSAKEYSILYPEKFKNYFTFSFVRNPWDLVVSRYHWSRYQKVNGVPLLPSATFHDFVSRLELLHQDLRNYREDLDGPQWIYLQSLRSQLNRISIDGQIAVNFIGRFETLSEDWGKVAKVHLALPETYKKLPHVFRSKRDDYRSYYNTYTKQVVSNWFAKDIDAFQYTF